jgi:hypothetical protein
MLYKWTVTARTQPQKHGCDFKKKKKNEILSFAGKWMELENINLSEVSQVRNVFAHMWNTDLTQIQQ